MFGENQANCDDDIDRRRPRYHALAIFATITSPRRIVFGPHLFRVSRHTQHFILTPKTALNDDGDDDDSSSACRSSLVCVRIGFSVVVRMDKWMTWHGLWGWYLYRVVFKYKTIYNIRHNRIIFSTLLAVYLNHNESKRSLFKADMYTYWRSVFNLY